MSSDKQLFFLALVPPAPVLEELMQLKKTLAEEYNAKAALRSPPHITLHMPFRFREDRSMQLDAALDSVCKRHAGFDVSLSGYDAFPPRVIYLAVKPVEGLISLQAAIQEQMRVSFNIFNARYRDRAFHPHLTLLFRDLRKSEFIRAWADLGESKYVASWEAADICLLRHSGKEWLEYRRFQLKGA